MNLYNLKPGPGAYNVTKPFGYYSLKASIKGRNQGNPNSSSIVPGPGQYKLPGLKKDGKYPFSNMRSTSSVSFGSPVSKRFNYIGKIFNYL